MIVLRCGGPQDLEEVAAIQRRSPEAAQWNPSDYLTHDFHVAALDGRVAGFLVARRIAPREYEILNLAVAPEYRRQGIARRLVEAFLHASPNTFFLEVRESNQAARAFYNYLGFQEVGRRSGYYHSPPETAIVMKFHSC
jgi:ribosomal-protein-alanine N-acetyltransferase